MNGLVVKNSPKVKVKIKDSRGNEWEEEALLDTGFSGTVSVPKFYVETGMIPPTKAGIERQRDYRMANGDLQGNTTYEGQILYPDGVWRGCLIESSSDEVMVGMRFLEGFVLVVDCKQAGAVCVHRKNRIAALLLNYLRSIG